MEIKFYGTFVLNRRVLLRPSRYTMARCSRGDAGSSQRSTEPGRPRRCRGGLSRRIVGCARRTGDFHTASGTCRSIFTRSASAYQDLPAATGAPSLVVQTREARGFDRLQVLRICAERHQRQTESATDLEDGRVALGGVGPVPVPVERSLQRLGRLLLRIRFPMTKKSRVGWYSARTASRPDGQRGAPLFRSEGACAFLASASAATMPAERLCVRREVAVLAQPHRARTTGRPRRPGLRRRRDQHLRPHLVGAREAEVAELHGDVEHARVHLLAGSSGAWGARPLRRRRSRRQRARRPAGSAAQRVSSVDDERQREDPS